MTPTKSDPGKEVSEELKPCPFCGAAGAGAWEKTVPGLGKAFTVFCHACDGEGPPMVTEADAVAAWNRRGPEPSTLVDDEDERGFTPSDYAHTAELLRSSEPIRKAVASNNHNIILAALDLCANRRSPPADSREREEAIEAARHLLKSNAEIIESDGGYCEYTRLTEQVCKALLCAFAMR